MIVQSSVADAKSDTDGNLPQQDLQEQESLKFVQAVAKRLRALNGDGNQDADYTVPVGWEERVGHLNDEPIRRLIIFLRSTGCEWVEKTGGCTMCGFYCATAHGTQVSADDYVSQFEYVQDAVDLREYPVISLYNDGNIFNESEMPQSAVDRICSIIDGYENIKKVVVESRIDYSPEENVIHMKKQLGGRQLEVAFGFESANPQVMNLCINKGFSSHNFDAFFSRMQRNGVIAKPLLLVKPPFLTESESVADVLKTIGYLFKRGLNYVDLEVTTVERNTVVHELWRNSMYRPPWLWSVIEILKRSRELYGSQAHVYVSPWTYSVESLDGPRNCQHCDADVAERIQEYNYGFDLSVFDGLDCSCRGNEWKAAMEETDPRQIPERIREMLAKTSAPVLS